MLNSARYSRPENLRGEACAGPGRERLRCIVIIAPSGNVFIGDLERTSVEMLVCFVAMGKWRFGSDAGGCEFVLELGTWLGLDLDLTAKRDEAMERLRCGASCATTTTTTITAEQRISTTKVLFSSRQSIQTKM